MISTQSEPFEDIDDAFYSREVDRQKHEACQTTQAAANTHQDAHHFRTAQTYQIANIFIHTYIHTYIHNTIIHAYGNTAYEII